MPELEFGPLVPNWSIPRCYGNNEHGLILDWQPPNASAILLTQNGPPHAPIRMLSGHLMGGLTSQWAIPQKACRIPVIPLLHQMKWIRHVVVCVCLGTWKGKQTGLKIIPPGQRRPSAPRRFFHAKWALRSLHPQPPAGYLVRRSAHPPMVSA
jgi:hypothetical protein